MRKAAAMRLSILASTVTMMFLQGCATSNNGYTTERMEQNFCKELQRPEYLSFKQLAFSVAKNEQISIGEVSDFYFFEKKFKSNAYRSIPEIKMDLESKHPMSVNAYNYATNNRDVDITASQKDIAKWFKDQESNKVYVKRGSYTVKDIVYMLGMKINLSVDKEFYSIGVPFVEDASINTLELLNRMTKAISLIANYDIAFENKTLFIKNATNLLNVKDDFIEPYGAMLDTKGIYYQKTDNSFVIKDSLYKMWYAKMFLKTLNFSEDRFTFCVHMNGDDTYGSFTSNDRIVLNGLGKIQLVDYGLAHEGKLKYKLKIFSGKENQVEAYTIYSDTDTFKTQLNNNATIIIKLY